MKKIKVDSTDVCEQLPVTCEVMKSPFTFERESFVLPPGTSVGEFLRGSVPRALDLSAIVYVDDMPVERDKWETAYPRPGQLVTVRVIPEGGRQGKNVLRTVLSIAMLYASGAALGWGIAKWGLAKGALFAAGVGVAGNYAIGRLVPFPEPTTDPTEGRVYSITGQNNRMNLYGPIPKIYGRMKVYPSLGARPYTEIVGSDVYMR